jgi:hypothetical protein
MTPIPGIVASQITGHLNNNSYESIQTVTVGSGGQSSISFTSIPQTYKHLQIRASYTGNDVPLVRLNGDTGSNYPNHWLRGNGSAASAAASAGAYNILQLSTSWTPSSTVPGVFIFDLLDYTNTNKYKTVRTLGGCDLNGSGGVELMSGLWMSTVSVNAISMTIGTSGSTYEFSKFALYGIKG